jgi:hypothetical protein
MYATSFCQIISWPGRPLPRKQLDHPALQTDLKGPIRSVDEKDNPLTSQSLLDGVVFVIHVHEAVGAHGCREKPRPWMASRKPIWVDSFVLYYNL